MFLRNSLNLASFSSSKLFIFAGQGTQQKGMLSYLNSTNLIKANTIAKQLLGIDFQEISSTDCNNLINQTQITQPLLLFSHYLHFQESYSEQLSPSDFMIGHSLGQYSALVNAKSLSFQDGLKLVHQRGSLMKKYTTCSHGMLIIKYKLDKEDYVIQKIKQNETEIACVNSRTSIIVAGKKERINQLSVQLKKNQIVSMNLPVSTAFHCKMLENMRQEFNQLLNKTPFQAPFCSIIRNYDTEIYNNSHDIREGLLKQLTNSVLFYQSVLKVQKSIPFYEVGHKKWISKFIQETRKEM